MDNLALILMVQSILVPNADLQAPVYYEVTADKQK
jgi:hypothetical protein